MTIAEALPQMAATFVGAPGSVPAVENKRASIPVAVCPPVTVTGLASA